MLPLQWPFSRTLDLEALSMGSLQQMAYTILGISSHSHLICIPTLMN